jgi:hypothetical protein
MLGLDVVVGDRNLINNKIKSPPLVQSNRTEMTVAGGKVIF